MTSTEPSSSSSSSSPSFELRKATPEDVDEILRLITGLAIYEREPNAVELTRETLLKDGFGPQPLFHCFLADVEEDDHEEKKKKKKTVGMALYFFTYSTWQGRVLFLEDIFVDEPYRGRGIGFGFFKILAKEAKLTNCARMQWQVLDWNTPSIEFYEKKIGGKQLKEWITMRMGRQEIDNFINSG